jgi:hypothetical protein
VGKAHFGALGTPGADPINLGFDVNIAGHAAGGPGSFYGTHRYSAAGRSGASVWDVPGLEKYHGQTVYLTDALTREAAIAIADAVQAGVPFFLNMAHYAVHAPIMADSAFVDRYPGADPIEAAYASMIEGTDASLGVILETLEDLGVAENTIILFMSDNGGLSAHARGTTPMGTGPNTHNLPLRSGKGSAYEGGTRVPMIVAWARSDSSAPAQAGLPVLPRTRTGAPVVSHDFFPSILQMAGIARPEGYAADGRSFVPILAGVSDGDTDRRLGWHYPHKWGPEGPGLDPFTSLREGDWRIIYFYRDRRWELYDLSRDLGETTNLLTVNPRMAARMADAMLGWVRDLDAQLPHDRLTDQPVPWPAFQASPEEE